MTMIKALTFDLWNTLIIEKSYNEFRVEVLRKALLEEGISRTRDEVMRAYEAATARYNRVWAEDHLHLPNLERINISLKLLGAELPDNVKASVARRFGDAFTRDSPELNEGA